MLNQAPLEVLRPEIALLLCCARTSIDAARAERIKTLLLEAIDWQYLLQTARAHGVMPLLYRSLHLVCPDAVPQAIRDHLQRHFHANALHNRFLTRELLKILNLCETQGISAIPYKGPSLAAAAYGDLALRQFGDLDLLIQPKDIQKATNLLVSQGYQPDQRIDEEATYLRHRFHVVFTRADKRVTIELHWAVTWRYWPFPFDVARMHARLAPVSSEGGAIPSLPPEDLLLILCVHGSKHLWERVMWICDVAELVHVHPQIDWQQTLQQASVLGGKRMLFLGLFLAKDLLGANLPEEVLPSIRADSRVQALAEQVKEQLFANSDGPRGDDDRPAFHLTAFYFKVRERWRDKIQLFVRYPFRRNLPSLPQRLPNLLKHLLGS